MNLLHTLGATMLVLALPVDAQLWESIGEYPPIADDPAAFRLDAMMWSTTDAIYVGGGNGEANAPANEFYRLDPVTLEWVQLANLPGPSDGYATRRAFVINDTLYIVAGCLTEQWGSCHAFQFYRYSNATNTWSDILYHYVTGAWWTSLNGTSVLVHDGRAYVMGVSIGDINEQYFLGEVRRFDPATMTTTVIDTIEMSRGMSWFVVGDHAYGLGGGYLQPNMNFLRYDLTTGDLSYLDAPSFLNGLGGVAESVATGHGPYGYFGFGRTGGGTDYFQEFWKYEPASAQWTQVASMNQSERHQAVICSRDGCMYCGLGYVPSGSTAELWRYCAPTSIPGIEASQRGVSILSNAQGITFRIYDEGSGFLEWFDMQGRIRGGKSLLGPTNVDLENLPPGVFAYQLTIGGSRVTGSFIH